VYSGGNNYREEVNMEHPLDGLGALFGGLGTLALGIAAIISAAKSKPRKKRKKKRR
jgi:hypothetical protein